MIERHELLAFLFACCLVQGAFLAPLVANLKHVNRRAIRILALLILCFLPSLGEEFLDAAGLIERFPQVIGSSITADFVIAPLLLFYARSLVNPSQPFTRRDLVHFIPFASAVIVLLPFMALSGPEKLSVLRAGLPPSFMLVIVAKIVVAAAYLTLVLVRLRRFMGRRDEPRARDPHVVWLFRAMVALAGAAVASVGVVVLAKAGVQLPFDSDTIGTVFICASIYTISAMLMKHPMSALAAEEKPLTQLVAVAPFRCKYETSPLDERLKQEYLDRLVQHVERHRPHLDMTLTLEKLAEALEIRSSHLSQVLNERLGMNFYEFVNSHRVREAQRRIADLGQSGRTLMAIAHDSGFNSKASFNRAFKRVVGQTPSEYARAVAQAYRLKPDASHYIERDDSSPHRLLTD